MGCLRRDGRNETKHALQFARLLSQCAAWGSRLRMRAEDFGTVLRLGCAFTQTMHSEPQRQKQATALRYNRTPSPQPNASNWRSPGSQSHLGDPIPSPELLNPVAMAHHPESRELKPKSQPLTKSKAVQAFSPLPLPCLAASEAFHAASLLTRPWLTDASRPCLQKRAGAKSKTTATAVTKSNYVQRHHDHHHPTNVRNTGDTSAQLE